MTRKHRQTFEARFLRKEESRMVPAESVLGVTPTRCHHFMESSDSVALFEFRHAFSHFIHHTTDIITLVRGWQIGSPYG